MACAYLSCLKWTTFSFFFLGRLSPPPNFQGGIFCLKTCPSIFLLSRRHLGFAWRHSRLFVRFALGLSGLRAPAGGEKNFTFETTRSRCDFPSFLRCYCYNPSGELRCPPSENSPFGRAEGTSSENPPFGQVEGPLAHLVSR